MERSSGILPKEKEKVHELAEKICVCLTINFKKCCDFIPVRKPSHLCQVALWTNFPEKRYKTISATKNYSC